MTEQHSESAKSLEIPAEHFSITLRQFSLGDAGFVFKLINKKGCMLKALLTLSTHAFYHGGYEELYGKVFKDNSQSARVLEKAGFRETGTEGEDKIYTLTKPKE